MSTDHYDVVVIGSGFGSLFFVEGFLRRRPDTQILVLERGHFETHAWQVGAQRHSRIDHRHTFRTPRGHKTWNFTIGVGGGTNCWFAQTPRLHPTDFRLHSRYGVAQDWPLTYDELEPFYAQAEQMMSVAGSDDMAAVLPRSSPFPLPAHKCTSVDSIMRRAQPTLHVPMATARASAATGQRGVCCGAARCSLCPMNAKFTFENGFAHLREHPSLQMQTGAEVTHIDAANGTARSVLFQHEGVQKQVSADLIVLGANAIHSPAILLRSGIEHPLTGVGLHEQVGYNVEVMLDGLDNLDGGTITTALNYSLYDGPFRRDAAGALLYFDNRWPHGLRTEYGRWRQLAPLMVVVEDIPQDANRVTLDSDGLPHVSHADVSDYAKKGVDRSWAALERVLPPLPLERILFRGMRATESHLLGSLRMGADAQTSVVDSHQLHHSVRNLVVVGSAVFPTGSCSNPSLTVAALSLRSAQRLA